MKKISSMGIALVVFTFVLAGCTQSNSTNADPTVNPDANSGAAGTMLEGTTPSDNGMVGGDAAPGAPGTDSQASGSADASAVKEIAVDSFSFGFSPSTIRVKAGEKVRVNVTNKGGFHDFAIDAFNVKVQTPANQTTAVEFTPDKPGTYEYYCTVGNHKAQGQKGTLIVE